MKSKAEQIFEALGAGHGFNGSQAQAIQIINKILREDPPPTDPAATESIFTAHSQIILSSNGPGQPAAVKEFNFGLEATIPGPLLERDYKDAHGHHTNGGIKVLTNALVLGLAGNIRAAEAANKWTRKDHIDFALNELSRAVTSDVVIFPGEHFYRGVLK